MILQADASRIPLADRIIQTCVTSPPYFGSVRDYEVEPTEWPVVVYSPMVGLPPVTIEKWTGCLGDEDDPYQYIGHLVHVFREVWRVLRDDGTLWVNIGDKYSNPSKWGGTSGNKNYTSHRGGLVRSKRASNLGDKNLTGIPGRLSLALQADGWTWRSEIVWAKPNGMPESVRDRPTRAHEQILFFSKQPHYYYDADAIRTPLSDETIPRMRRGVGQHKNVDGAPGSAKHTIHQPRPNLNKQDGAGRDTYTGFNDRYDPSKLSGANRRDVWTISPGGYKGEHFAVFPLEIPELCIKAGTSEKGCCSECGMPYKRIKTTRSQYEKREPSHAGDNVPTKVDSTGWKPPIMVDLGFGPACDCVSFPLPCIVLDPFNGSGTTGLAARMLGRDYIGLELKQDFIKMSKVRIAEEYGALSTETAEAVDGDVQLAFI